MTESDLVEARQRLLDHMDEEQEEDTKSEFMSKIGIYYPANYILPSQL